MGDNRRRRPARECQAVCYPRPTSRLFHTVHTHPCLDAPQFHRQVVGLRRPSASGDDTAAVVLSSSLSAAGFDFDDADMRLRCLYLVADTTHVATAAAGALQVPKWTCMSHVIHLSAVAMQVRCVVSLSLVGLVSVSYACFCRLTPQPPPFALLQPHLAPLFAPFYIVLTWLRAEAKHSFNGFVATQANGADVVEGSSEAEAMLTYLQRQVQTGAATAIQAAALCVLPAALTPETRFARMFALADAFLLNRPLIEAALAAAPGPPATVPRPTTDDWNALAALNGLLQPIGTATQRMSVAQSPSLPASVVELNRVMRAVAVKADDLDAIKAAKAAFSACFNEVGCVCVVPLSRARRIHLVCVCVSVCVCCS